MENLENFWITDEGIFGYPCFAGRSLQQDHFRTDNEKGDLIYYILHSGGHDVDIPRTWRNCIIGPDRAVIYRHSFFKKLSQVTDFEIGLVVPYEEGVPFN